MKKSKLTLEENEELTKRGFLIKESVSIRDFYIDLGYGGIISIILIIFLLALIGTPIFLINSIFHFSSFGNCMYWIMTIGYMILIPYFIYYYSYSAYYYIVSSNLFYTEKRVLGFGKVFLRNENIGHYIDRIFIFRTLYQNISRKLSESKNIYLNWYSFGVYAIIYSFPAYISLLGMVYGKYSLILILGLLMIIPFLGNQIIQILNPIYTFGKIGKKVQEITPEIKTKCRYIQKNFKKNMNFSELSKGFHAISTDFSQIMRFIIQLETIETQLQQGDIFDAHTYISSLKWNIVGPLQSLKIFLENQKSELLLQKNVLQKVKIGGDYSLDGSGDVSGIRTHSLIGEMTDHIEKLDEMIQKMG